MITIEEIESIGFREINSGNFCTIDFEYEFNIRTQELWSINDGFGEPTFLCRVTKIEKLQELIDLNP